MAGAAAARGAAGMAASRRGNGAAGWRRHGCGAGRRRSCCRRCLAGCPAGRWLGLRNGRALPACGIFTAWNATARVFAPPQWPEGVTIRPFDGSEKMLAAWNTAYNTGFACPLPLPSWHRGRLPRCRRGGLRWRSALAFMAAGRWVWCASPEVKPTTAALVKSSCSASLPFTGAGFGRALLRSGLQRLRSSGCTRYRLTADTGSPVAPLLYASEGFRSTRVHAIWERRI